MKREKRKKREGSRVTPRRRIHPREIKRQPKMNSSLVIHGTARGTGGGGFWRTVDLVLLVDLVRPSRGYAR